MNLEKELAAAHAAVDDAVQVLLEGRREPLTRTAKAAKDFLTEVDLASEAAMKASLAAFTPEIGFYGEEGGGADLHTGAVWVADPLDGTINYATGSPMCGVMLGLLVDGEPVLGMIDLPFLGVRVTSGEVADVTAFDEAIIGMGDAFHRGGERMDVYLALSVAVHKQALRFRCVGSAAVLWTWLAGGQIQGMLLSHNNPYDVVAGHAIARSAGAIVTDYAGAPLTLDSHRRDGHRARHPRRARRDGERPGSDLHLNKNVVKGPDPFTNYFGGIEAARSAPRSTHSASVASSSRMPRSTSTKPFIGLLGLGNSVTCELLEQGVGLLRLDPHEDPALAGHADGHVAVDHEADPAEHLLLADAARACRRSRTRSASCSS